MKLIAYRDFHFSPFVFVFSLCLSVFVARVMAPVTRSRLTEPKTTRQFQPADASLSTGNLENDTASDITPSTSIDPSASAPTVLPHRKSRGALNFLFSGGQDAEPSRSVARKRKSKPQPKGKVGKLIKLSQATS